MEKIQEGECGRMEGKRDEEAMSTAEKEEKDKRE